MIIGERPFYNPSDMLNKKGEELRLLYQVYIDDIKTTKRQQWAIPNYVILLFAAIFGFSRYIGKPFTGFELIILFVPAFLIHLLGIWGLISIQAVLVGYRKKLVEIEKDMTLSFKEIAKESRAEDYLKFKYYFKTITFPFILLIYSSFVYLSWYLFKCVYIVGICLIIDLIVTVLMLIKIKKDLKEETLLFKYF
jgi:hypothetical protein